MLYNPETQGKMPEGYYSGGNPILYPSVGRTWDRSGNRPEPDKYWIFGRENVYKMPCHGIVPAGRWVQTKEQSQRGKVEVEYSFSLSEKTMSEHYPFDMSFLLRYTLKKYSVGIEAIFRNNGTSPAPFAFGYHPYFQFSDRSNICVHLPCGKRALLDPELLIPTGESKMSSSTLSFERGKACDMAFTGINGKRASVINKSTGAGVHVDFDENIEMLVVYSGTDSNYVCLEPWTRGLGAYEKLRHANWTDSGEIPVLQPQQTKTVNVKYSVR